MFRFALWDRVTVHPDSLHLHPGTDAWKHQHTGWCVTGRRLFESTTLASSVFYNLRPWAASGIPENFCPLVGVPEHELSAWTGEPTELLATIEKALHDATAYLATTRPPAGFAGTWFPAVVQQIIRSVQHYLVLAVEHGQLQEEASPTPEMQATKHEEASPTPEMQATKHAD